MTTCNWNLRHRGRRTSLMLALAVSIALPAGTTTFTGAQAQQAAPASSDQPSEAALPGNPLHMAILSGLQAGKADAKVISAYEARGYAPYWLDASGFNEPAHLLLAAFADANAHALNPENYDPIGFANRADNAGTIEDWASIETDLTRQFLRYATHLSSGRVQPNEINKALNIFPHVPEPDVLLDQAATTPDFSAFLEALSPNTPNYARLKRRLAQYRDKAALGGFTPIPEGETLKPGMEDQRVPLLRQRLSEEDFMDATSHTGSVYDGSLVDAVKTFQDHHGIAVDGVIGPSTLAEINVPIEKRLIQMELNMERRRWMPDFLGDTYVFVNLADQNLKVVKNDKTWHTARVVVGKPYHATPVFSDEMTYVEINPFWNVPRSIATNEYLPKLRQNPNALSAQNIRIFSGEQEIAPTQVAWNSYSGGNFPFKLRQDPGGKNALGRIKFMFPNQFNIYIHDTPSKALFDRAQRSFSHGCIRVSDPFALGSVLLGDQGYDRAKLEALRDSGERKIVKLDRPIPVHLTYLTAWMNKDGSTHFRQDIYDRDQVLQKALAEAMTKNL